MVTLHTLVRSAGADRADEWRRLAAGRLSLVERDVDGERSWAVVESAPAEVQRRALTPRQVQVVEACAVGASNKQVASDLGLSTALVSRALTGAAQKIGAGDVRRMLRVASCLLERRQTLSFDGLTPAERAVAGLVSLGLTNAEIARRRGAALRTVANQVSSIFRKTGADSRRELVVHRSGDGPTGPLPLAGEGSR